MNRCHWYLVENWTRIILSQKKREKKTLTSLQFLSGTVYTVWVKVSQDLLFASSGIEVTFLMMDSSESHFKTYFKSQERWSERERQRERENAIKHHKIDSLCFYLWDTSSRSKRWPVFTFNSIEKSCNVSMKKYLTKSTVLVYHVELTCTCWKFIETTFLCTFCFLATISLLFLFTSRHFNHESWLELFSPRLLFFFLLARSSQHLSEVKCFPLKKKIKMTCVSCVSCNLFSSIWST